MEPSIFFVLFWRMALDVLFPYIYMESSLQDALGSEHILWSTGSRIERQLLAVSREAFRTILMMVMLMEMFQVLDAALALNIPVNRRRRL